MGDIDLKGIFDRPLVPGRAVTQNDVSWIFTLARSAKQSLQQYPRPSNLIQVLGALSHMVVIVHSCHHQDQILLRKAICESGVLDIVRERNRIVRDEPRSMWLSAEEWAAVTGLRMYIYWLYWACVGEEVDVAFNWIHFMNTIEGDQGTDLRSIATVALTECRGLPALPDQAYSLQLLQESTPTLCDIVHDDTTPLSSKIGSLWVLTSIARDSPDLALQAFEESSIFECTVHMLQQALPDLFPQRPHVAPSNFAATEAYDTTGILRHMMLLYMGICFRVNRRHQEFVAAGRIEDARTCWSQWMTPFNNSGCVDVLIRFLQAFTQLEDISKTHPVITIGVSTLLVVVGNDDNIRRRIVVTAQTRHRLDVIDLLLYLIDHADEVPDYVGATKYDKAIVGTMIVAKLLIASDDDNAEAEGVNNIEISEKIVSDLVHEAWRALNGETITSIITILECIENLAQCDSNAAKLLEHDICGLLHKVLTQPKEEIAALGGLFYYNQDAARDVALKLLLRISLSDVGVATIRVHADLMTALASQLQVPAASASTRNKVDGILARLRTTGDIPVQLASIAAAKEREKQTLACEAGEGGTYDVMLSYCWDNQSEVHRVHRALQARGYSVWIDVEQMQGCTVDAMAVAVESSHHVVYAVSHAYKNSSPCRLEANYAFQLQKKMVPLMMEEGYAPKGWLGIMLGTRLWYGFFGSVLADESLFEAKMNDLCRELGPPQTKPNAATPTPVPTRDHAPKLRHARTTVSIGNGNKRASSAEAVVSVPSATPTGEPLPGTVTAAGGHQPSSRRASEASTTAGLSPTQHAMDDEHDAFPPSGHRVYAPPQRTGASLHRTISGVHVSPGAGKAAYRQQSDSREHRRISTSSAAQVLDWDSPVANRTSQQQQFVRYGSTVDSTGRGRDGGRATEWRSTDAVSISNSNTFARAREFSAESLNLAMDVNAFGMRLAAVVAEGHMSQADADQLHDATHECLHFVTAVIGAHHGTADNRLFARQVARRLNVASSIAHSTAPFAP
eukprot:m.467209 g.467209  ORF g.467209 m.467209 type:complete len:1019 (+) comp21634_c0_seq2:536-3592(+)